MLEPTLWIVRSDNLSRCEDICVSVAFLALNSAEAGSSSDQNSRLSTTTGGRPRQKIARSDSRLARCLAAFFLRSGSWDSLPPMNPRVWLIHSCRTCRGGLLATKECHLQMVFWQFP